MHITATPLHWPVWSQSRKGKQIHCVGEKDGESVLGSLSMANMRRSWQSCAATESKRWSRPTSSSPSWIVVGGLRLGEDVTSGQPLLLPIFAFGITANTWIFDENWRLKPAAQRRRLIYCVRKNSILGITVTNLNVVWYFLTWTTLILRHTKNKKFSPTLRHRSDVISDVIKNAVYRQRRTFNKIFRKGKTWHCKLLRTETVVFGN